MRAHAKDVLLHNQNYLATQPLGCYRYSPCSCVLPLHPCNPSRNEGRYRRCSLKREAERCYRLLEPPSYRARLLVLCLLSRFLYGLAATARAASCLCRAAGGSTCGAVPVRSVSADSRRIRERGYSGEYGRARCSLTPLVSNNTMYMYIHTRVRIFIYNCDVCCKPGWC
jgi:hypothetical protein